MSQAPDSSSPEIDRPPAVDAESPSDGAAATNGRNGATAGSGGPAGPRGTEGPDGARRGSARTLVGLFLAALCAGVWGLLLGAEFSNDDELLILNNLFIRDFAHLWDNVTHDYFYNSQGSSIGYWRPLTKVTYMVDWSLWGANPVAYYAVNLVLFTSAILLGALVMDRCGAPWPVVVGAAALAAVHPAHAESVGIVTSRSDPLVAAFLLGVLAAELAPGGPRRLVGLACAVLAVLSKEVGVIAPVLVVLTHLVRPKRERPPGSPPPWRRAVRAALPYLGVVAVYALVRLGLDIRPQPGVHADVEGGTLALATGKVAGIYAARLLVPFLVEPIVRPAVFPEGADAATLAWCALAVLAVAAGLATLRKRGAWLALGLVFLPLAPALSLRYVSISVHADRLPVFDRGMILPSIGVGWLLAAGVYALATRLRARGLPSRWLAGVAAGWGIVLAVGAVDNARDAQTAETRAAAFIEGLDESDEDLPLFQRQIILEERAIAFAQSGDLESAEKAFLELVELDSTNAAARGNLAMLYQMTGRPQLAIEQLRWVLEHSGTTRTARDRRAMLLQLAQAYAQAGDPERAQRVFEEAQKLAPDAPTEGSGAGQAGD